VRGGGAALAVAAVVLAVPGCTPAERVAPVDLTAGRHVVALLADRRLVAASVDGSAGLRGTLALPGDGPPDQSTGHLLGLDRTRHLVQVLVRSPSDGGSVVTVDERTFTVHTTRRLTRGGNHRSLTVAPGTGNVYLVGDRAEPDGRSAWLTRLPPVTGDGRSWQLRAADGRDWVPYVGTVAADESYLAVSYHGEHTTGADLVGLDGEPAQACPLASTAPQTGCLPSVHGVVVATRNGGVGCDR
jgi:hypothetical protein